MRRADWVLRGTALLALALQAGLPLGAGAETSAGAAVRFDCTEVSRGTDEALLAELSAAIARMWNLGAVSAEAMQSAIMVRVCFTPEGKPEQVLLIAAEGPSHEAVDHLYETARRALMRAYSDGKLPLPPETHDTWRVLDLVFDANAMRLP